MRYLLSTLHTKSRYGRMLPYALLSALITFLGVRVFDGDTDSDVTTIKSQFAPPPAHADVPSGGSGCSGVESCSSGDSPPGCCFPATARIKVPSGFMPISSLQEGDVVNSYNEKSGEFTTSRVAKVLLHNSEGGDKHDFNISPLLRVTYLKSDNQTDVAVVTANHPVLDGISKEYREARTFAAGDKLITPDGSVEIISVEEVSEASYVENDGTVYNLTLTDGPHTYIADGVVVHNKDPDTPDTCCFPAGVLVEAKSGPQAIELLAEGEEVVSYDEETNTWVTSVIGEVIVHDGQNHSAHNFTEHGLLEVVYKDGDGMEHSIPVTGNHPVFDSNQNNYRSIESFSEGDGIRTQAGDVSIIRITKLDPTTYFNADSQIVYNLHMKEGPANYIANGVLVHNKDYL